LQFNYFLLFFEYFFIRDKVSYNKNGISLFKLRQRRINSNIYFRDIDYDYPGSIIYYLAAQAD